MELQTTATIRPHHGRRSNQEVTEIINEYEASGFTLHEYCDSVLALFLLFGNARNRILTE
ncbi:MAG: hypothetical protein J7497_16830 [Chitinophagaceae bacterium]|nr:hypothetical protein [Chitinophagaceae bacterium]